MAALNFGEDKSYTVDVLYYLDNSGKNVSATDVTVRFTTGWIAVEEGDSSFVMPRERVLRAEGIDRAKTKGRIVAH